MPPSSAIPVSRQTTRHLVAIPCDVISNWSDKPVPIAATDMSASGMWLDTKRPHEVGDELVLCFRPSVYWRAREIHVFAKVARISRGKRAGDGGSGMGVEFLDLTEAQLASLRCWLKSRPERPPRRREVDGKRRAVAMAAHSFFAQICGSA